MHRTKRHALIESNANRLGFASIDTLADLCGVSAQTVRRDIKDLSDAGRIVRLHGGAGSIPLNGCPAIEERRGKNLEAKHAIGKLAATVIPDHARLFIGAGSTMEIVSEHLSAKQGLTVLTVNIQVALIMHNYPGIHLILPHGNLRPDLYSLAGSDVVDSITRYSMDFALVTTGGIHENGDFYDLSDTLAPIVVAMQEHARETILIADSSKFAPKGCRKTGNLATVQTLITDRAPDAPMIELLERSGTTLLCG